MATISKARCFVIFKQIKQHSHVYLGNSQQQISKAHMNIFITGGSGFLGSRLIKTLVNSNHKVWALARSADAQKIVMAAGATPVMGSLDQIPRWAGALSQCEIVIHCAAPIDLWKPWPFFENEIVNATQELLVTAEQNNVKRFIYISSEAALQNSISLMDIDETTPYPEEPNSYYGKAKQLAEKNIQAFSGTIETIILRPTFIWGANCPALEDICQRARNNQFLWIDQGKSAFEQVHVDNVVQAVSLACTTGKSGSIYYVTDDHPLSVRAFFSAVFLQYGITPPRLSLPSAMLATPTQMLETIWKILPGKPPLTRFELAFLSQPRRYNINKIKQELTYKPKPFATLLLTLRH